MSSSCCLCISSPSLSVCLSSAFSLYQLCAHVTRIFAQLKSIKLHFRLNKLGPRFASCCRFHLPRPHSLCPLSSVWGELFVYVSALGVLVSRGLPSTAALRHSSLSLPLSISLARQTLNTLATCHSYACCLLSLCLFCCLSCKYPLALST